MSSAVVESRTSYLLDKLHSLSGVVPIGAYLVEHFFENSYALVSPDKYNYIAAKLETVPWRLPIEFFLIWAPILFHGFYGIYIWWSGKSNALGHPWMANWMYVLQRWTGIIAFFFIGYHVWTVRFVSHGRTTYADIAQTMSNPLYVAIYVVGILAASFHLGNGLWNFACKWGIAVTARSQRAAAWSGALVAIVFSVVGLAIIAGFHYHWTPFDTYLQ
jgi:succinate dehydrogenase / fumarate reductase cytochrome b subunit